MSSVLRVVLILGAFAILFVIVKKLRKAQIQVLDSVFWLFFALSFVVFAAVPQIAFWLAGPLASKARRTSYSSMQLRCFFIESSPTR